MATWEDGPEYAPALRPDHFAEPAAAAPLSAGPPVHPPASRSSQPESFERPGFSQPQAPVAPLESLVPPLEETRDPSMPFEVVSATMTEATSAWSAAHWSPPSGPTALSAAPSGPPAFAAGPSASPATIPALPSPPPALLSSAPAAAGPQPAPFPAPGTTAWFQPAPPPYATAPRPPTSGPGAVAQALTPGVLISLVIGGLIWPLAPVAYGIAFALASRVRAGRSGILATFTAGLSVLVVVGIVSALLSEDVLLFFSDWWALVARWSQALCWVVLLVSCVVVWRALRAAAPGGGPPPTVWG